MINTVCVSIFKTLTESEVKAFGSYLTASYQKSGSIYKLYNYLKKNHPDLTKEKLERKIVEKKLFKEKANPERTLFDTSSKLTAKLKSFITIQELEKQEVDQNFLYLEALKSRKLDELFFRKAESLQQKWDEDSIPGIEHFYHQYKLKVLKFSHPNFSVQKIKKESELKNIIDLLDQHYVAAKMYYSLIYNINNVNSITEKYSIIKILNNFEDAVFSNKVKIRLLYHFLIAYKSSNFRDFKEIKSTFFDIHHYFTQSEKHDLVDVLKYFFYSKRHEVKVTKELFDIVKFSLNESLLLEDGYLSNQSFDNCIQFAKANNEIEWIEKFMENYKDVLHEKDKEDYLAFGKYIVLFYKNQFDDALEKLSLIRIKKPIRLAQLNCCKLQCLYELKYEDAFHQAINSSNQYLSNHKEDLKQNFNFTMFKNFISFIKKIFSIERKSNTNKNEKINKLQVMLVEIDKIKIKPYDMDWLISVINKSISKYKN